MKSIVCSVFFLALSFMGSAQSIGVGTVSPAPSSALDISSTTKGVLFPRMTSAQRDAIVSPAAGLVILNVDDYCLDVFDGAHWSKNCGLRITGVDSMPESWTSLADMPSAGRYGAVSFVINGKAYVGTGYDGQFKNDLWEYNPVTNVWIQKANLIGIARWCAVGYSVLEAGYIATGSGGQGYLNDVWKYEAGSNTWNSQPNFPGSPRMFSLAVTDNTNSYVYVVGGSPNTNDTWRFDPISNSWVQLAMYPAPSIYGAVGFMAYGYLHVGTGFVNGSVTNTFYYYDPNSNAWFYHSALNAPARYFATGFSINNNFYVYGGSNGSGTVFGDMLEYTTATGWHTLDSLPGSPRYQATGFVINGKGYVTTGALGSTLFNDLWSFHPGSLLGNVYESPVPPGDAYVFDDGIWSRDSTDRVFSDEGSLVGIGTSTPAAKLDVNGSLKVSGEVASPLQFNNADAIRKLVLASNGNNNHEFTGFGTMSDGLEYHVASSGMSHIFYAGISNAQSQEVMRIAGYGNVGIGISNPNNKLDIQSGPARTGIHAVGRPFYVTGPLMDSSNGIEFRHDNGTQGIGFGFNTIYATGSNTNQDLGLASRGTGALKFSTNGLERMRINGTGSVTINGLIENESYNAPAFLNGFTNYANGYVSAGYYKDKQGIVRLRGTVYLPTNPNGLGIFVLPAGYRPTTGTVAFIVSNNNTSGKVEVLWDGSVFVQNCAAGSISLDGITFRAE